MEDLQSASELPASAKDLPMSANLQDITVKHFILDLHCKMDERVLEGSVTLFCHPTRKKSETTNRNDPPSVGGGCQTAVESSVGEGNGTEERTHCSREEDQESDQVSSDCDFAVHTDRNRQCDGTDHGQNPSTKQSKRIVQLSDSDSSGQVFNRPVEVSAESDKRHQKCFPQSNCLDSGRKITVLPEDECMAATVTAKAPFQDHTYTQEESAVEVPDVNVQSALERESKHEVQAPCSLHQQLADSSREHSDRTKQSHEQHTAGFGLTSKSNLLSSTYHEQTVCNSAFSNEFEAAQHNFKHPSGKNNTKLDVETSTNQSCHIVTDASVMAETKHGCSQVKSTRCVPEANDSTGASQKQMNHNDTDSFNQRCCSASPHLQSTKEETRTFKMILDSYKLKVEKVEGLFLQDGEKLLFKKNPEELVKEIGQKDLSGQSGCQWQAMSFLVQEHCLVVWTESVHSVEQFPDVVQVWYQTCPESPSLMWTTDQDGNACVFTIGHFLSNRGLFPSQDTPTALPTWHANITVDGDLTVLLTGDREPQISITEHGQTRFSYFTTFPMPSCTFALAIGSWQNEMLRYPSCDPNIEQKLKEPTLRLFFPQKLRDRSISVLSSYLPLCMLEAQRMLGTYPFHRLDVLIVPACFDSLGMTSPSLLFLSQSLLCGDGSMCVRVAHELCHTWFGIVIGPLDWTEEWMTEGFCTYLEDILHAQVSQLGERTEDYIGLRAQIHLTVLKAELHNTDESLQSLRPNKGTADTADGTPEQARYLKNGMNVEKKFMQVHYLKGYFLLQSLEKKVGRPRFLAFLKSYVQRYINHLVTSQDFLNMFVESFPDLKHTSVEEMNSKWLDYPGMPESLANSEEDYSSNVMSTQVIEQLSLLQKACRSSPGRKRRRGRLPRPAVPALHQLLAPQVVLLLDRLLEEETVPGHVLDLLRRVHGRHLENAEVCHRWCELVVKHRHKKCFSDVEHFLIFHQAMGVYLYGEAMISESPDVIQLARTCFRQLQSDMPESVRDTVSAMLYAT